MDRVMLVVLMGIFSCASAQEYPVREIRSVCNFAPGSGADIVVRFYSDQLSKLAPSNSGTEPYLLAAHARS